MDTLRGWKACRLEDRQAFFRRHDRTSFTPREIAEHRLITWGDKIWVLVRVLLTDDPWALFVVAERFGAAPFSYWALDLTEHGWSGVAQHVSWQLNHIYDNSRVVPALLHAIEV